MSIDLSAIAATGRDVLASAIQTSGTRVDVYFESDDMDSTVDLDTLEITDPTPERATLRDQPALIVNEGATPEQVGPAREAAAQTYRVLFLSTVGTVPEGAVLIPRRCPDARLVNARLRVTAVLDDPLAVSRPVQARRIT